MRRRGARKNTRRRGARQQGGHTHSNPPHRHFVPTQQDGGGALGFGHSGYAYATSLSGIDLGGDMDGSGTYYDNQGTDTFTITGGPTGSDYEYAALDLNGVEVTSVNCGAFADTSPTNSDNVFTFTSGIPSLKSFRVKVTLDSTSTVTDVLRLID